MNKNLTEEYKDFILLHGDNLEQINQINHKVDMIFANPPYFFVQPKWKIANDIPGSGNTRNIGGITNIEKLIKGEGPFAQLGEDVFDDYWMGYFNKDDAQKAGIGFPHYNNLKTYKEYLESQANKLSKL